MTHRHHTCMFEFCSDFTFPSDARWRMRTKPQAKNHSYTSPTFFPPCSLLPSLLPSSFPLRGVKVSENAVINFLIKAKKGVLSMGDKYPTFGSLDSLVKHFSSDKRNGFPTRLTKPCPSPVDAGGGGGGANAGRRKAPLTKSEMEAKKRRRRARRDKVSTG